MIFCSYTPRDRVLLADAARLARALDAAGVPRGDPRRVIHVDANTRRDWELRGVEIKTIYGLRIVFSEEI